MTSPSTTDESDRLAETLSRFNGVLSEMGASHLENLARLVAAAGKAMGANACVYALITGDEFSIQSAWSADDASLAEGGCEREVIARNTNDHAVVVKLPDATYAGRQVKVRGVVRGAVGVYFSAAHELTALDEQLLALAAHWIAGEQDREDTRQEILIGEEKFGAFFRSSLDGVLIHDLAGRVVDANPSAERMFGYPHAWLVKMNLTRLVPVESAPIARQALREVKATGYSRREIVLRRMDGTLFPAEIVGSRFEVNGEPRVHGIIRDISQRKQAQDEAAERELRFREVFDQSLDGIMLKDQSGRVIEANETMAKLLGCTKEALLGMNLSDFYETQDLQQRLRSFREVQESGELRYECSFRRHDGSVFAAEVAASSFSHGGQTFVQEIVRDVTARRESEAEIRRAKEEAERANEAKSVFLATMSHEIRTPLNGIIGFARLLEEGQLDPTQQQHLGMVKTSGSILLALINDILDFSRIESGKLELEDVAFSPARLLSDTLALHAPAAREKDLQLVQYVGPEVPSMVRGDPARLRQVLMNLIGNAVKFTEEGSVTVTLSVDEKQRLRFSVVDTGPGFTPEQQAQLFQPFYQTDLSATRKHGGTGLGLVICRRLMQAMGGSITAQRHEQGAEFRFWFPLVVATDREPRRTVAPAIGTRPVDEGTRVLVAEDQPINARLICLLLERLGIAVEIVGDGPAVLDRLKNTAHLPDAILLDMRMPGMDGTEVARRIRAGEAGAQAISLPLVAVTANALEGDRKACIDAGMDKHLAKPVTPESLERVLLEIGILCTTDSGSLA